MVAAPLHSSGASSRQSFSTVVDGRGCGRGHLPRSCAQPLQAKLSSTRRTVTILPHLATRFLCQNPPAHVGKQCDPISQHTATVQPLPTWRKIAVFMQRIFADPILAFRNIANRGSQTDSEIVVTSLPNRLWILQNVTTGVFKPSAKLQTHPRTTILSLAEPGRCSTGATAFDLTLILPAGGYPCTAGRSTAIHSVLSGNDFPSSFFRHKRVKMFSTFMHLRGNASDTANLGQVVESVKSSGSRV